MVRLHLALSTLLLAHASAGGVTTESNAKAKFLSVMRKVVKDKDIQMRQAERTRKLTKKIASKSKNLRKVEDAAEEANYYAAADDAVEAAADDAAEEAAADDAAEEAAADDAAAEAAADDAAEEAAADDAAADDAAEEATDDAAEEATDDAAEEATDDAAEEATDDAAEEATDDATDDATGRSYYAKAWGNDDGYDYSGLTFDLSQFSLKMHSCRSLTDFDLDELNNEEQAEAKEYEKEELQEMSYPFTGVPYVNFRLCPTSTCQDDGWAGCREVYGNYMVSLEDYFQLTEEHLEEELEEYCDYCKSCNYFYKYFNAQCEYYEECQTYGNVCNNYGYDDDKQENKYEEYLECTAVDKTYYQQYYNAAYQSGYNNRRTEEAEEEENDDQVYLKVFCNGSIRIGIFSDDECTNYIGQTTTIYEATGLTILEDDLEADFMNHKCIHCGKDDNKYYVVNQEKYQEQQNQDDDAAQDDEDGIYDICQNMYEESAKCNAFLPNPPDEYEENEYYQYYQKQQQDGYYEYDEEWEETKNPFACAFMEAVQKGNIDKYGIVHLSSNVYFKDYINKVNNDFLPEGYYLTDNQFFAIIGATIFCSALAVYGLMKPKKVIYNKELSTTLV